MASPFDRSLLLLLLLLLTPNEILKKRENRILLSASELGTPPTCVHANSYFVLNRLRYSREQALQKLAHFEMHFRSAKCRSPPSSAWHSGPRWRRTPSLGTAAVCISFTNATERLPLPKRQTEPNITRSVVRYIFLKEWLDGYLTTTASKTTTATENN